MRTQWTRMRDGMYGGMCPTCKRDLTDGVCIYCISVAELRDAVTYTPCRIRIPEDCVVEMTVPLDDGGSASDAVHDQKSESESEDGRGTSPDTLLVTCVMQDEVITNTSLNPVIGVLEVDNAGETTLLTVNLLLEDRRVYRSTFRAQGGRSRLDLRMSASLIRSPDSNIRTVTVIVEVDDCEIARQTSSIKVRAVNDLPLTRMQDEIPRCITPSCREIREMLAGDGPVMASLQRIRLDDIRNLKMGCLAGVPYRLATDSLQSYQFKNPAERLTNVMAQAMAVFNALSGMGLKYVDFTSSEGSGQHVFQRVNLPSETLREKRGVCLDFSCLVASVLEGMGLNPILVFPPGHAMVGVIVSSGRIPYVDNADYSGCRFIHTMDVETGDGHKDTIQAVFIESTLIGTSSFAYSLERADSKMREYMETIMSERMYTVVYFRRRHGGVLPLESSPRDIGGRK